MMYDTDIIIWFLRGNQKARHLLENDTNKSISAITYIEVIKGLKNKDRLLAWKQLVSDMTIKTISINESISTKAIYLIEEYSLSHGLELADAHIAATADTYGLTFITANKRDFSFIPGLNLKIFKE